MEGNLEGVHPRWILVMHLLCGNELCSGARLQLLVCGSMARNEEGYLHRISKVEGLLVHICISVALSPIVWTEWHSKPLESPFNPRCV